jgi:hypothetical protein
MPTTTITAQAQLVEAVDKARHSRHHPDCRCNTYKDLYCTVDEWRWTSMVDRLIDKARQEVSA